MFTLAWITVLMLLFAAGQILTGCWLAFFWRCKDAGRAWRTLRYCLKTKTFDAAVLRSHLGVDH